MTVIQRNLYTVSAGTVTFSGSGNRTATFSGAGNSIAVVDAAGNLQTMFGLGSLLVVENGVYPISTVNDTDEVTLLIDGPSGSGLSYRMLAATAPEAMIAGLLQTFPLRGGAEYPFDEWVWDDGTLRFRVISDAGLIKWYVGPTKPVFGAETAVNLAFSIDPATGAVTIAGFGVIDWSASVDVASAATTNIGAAASNLVRITGTTTITSLGTTNAGVARWVRFAGALTLTHNATSLILPYGANITTEAGATALFVSEGSGNWRCYWYQAATSLAARTIIGALAKAGDTILGPLELAASVDVASAATTNIGAAASNLVRITGTTTITSLGTTTASVWRLVRFAGALTLTHNATSLILPYGGNITTAAGDVALFVSEGSGNWRCYFYNKLSGGGTTNFLRADGQWAVPPGGTAGRELLTANRTYYVRTDGSDSNNGLANTSGGAFLTIQKAVDVACSLDLGIYAVTINVADGTYTGAVTLKKYIGVGPISIIGNTTTPANVAISVTSNNCFAANQTPAYTLSGMKLSTTTSGSGVRAQNGSPITLSHIHFGACATVQIWAESNATISITTAYTIDGGSGRHWLAYRGGMIFGPGAVTITLTGTPNFTTAFADSQLGAGMEVNGITFSGSATGKRYSVTMNAFINTIGGGATYLPGDVAGTSASGGEYA